MRKIKRGKVKKYKIITTLKEGICQREKTGVFYRLDGELYYREVENIDRKK